MNEKIYCLWFLNLKGIRFEKLIKLYHHFGSFEALYKADKKALEGISFLTENETNTLLNKNKDLADKILSDCEITDTRFVSYFDKAYPDILRNISNPPKILYIKGAEMDFNNIVTVTIVGSRRPSNYGDKMSFKLGYDLAKEGVTIVSGMARGIDAKAQRGALKAGGKTIAVLGTGCDVVYPPEHKELMEVIKANGCVISEYPPGTPVARTHFPERNRIMSGLAMGVIVVEGEANSGTGITARLCSEQGKELFCLPGNVDSPLSYIPNAYIKDGCPAITEAKDVIIGITALYPELMLEKVLKGEQEEVSANIFSSLNEAQGKIASVLSKNTPMHIDDICYSCGLDIAEVNRELLLLEISGIVVSMAGRNYMLR